MSATSTSALLLAVLVSPVAGQVTQRVSVASSGAQGNSASEELSISADGRYVAFASRATNLVSGDTNANYDIFVRDRQLGTTERASVDSSGAQANTGGHRPSISADGRYVAFQSYSTNLVTGDTNGVMDVFVHDRQLGATERVSIDSSGAQANGSSGEYGLSISADGRYVAFWSLASNLVAGDTNGYGDVFVRDRQLGTTQRVSVDSGGLQANFSSGDYGVLISADGRYAAFQSWASNLVSGDTNGGPDVFVHDCQSGATERVSVDSGGAQANADSGYYGLAISADGQFAVFQSYATNLVPGDTNGTYDVFMRDRQLGTTERISVGSGGAQANGESSDASISPDGRYVAFTSLATNLVSGDTNGTYDVFMRDRQLGTTERVSVNSGAMQANSYSFQGSISADARYMAFQSWASNLVAGDTNGYMDDFVRDRDATGFTSLCDPGVSGVNSCPCSNPPSGSGRGCDNSSSTGGAALFASGIAYLSMDSLVFATSGEKPTATSIVLQGNTIAASGIVFGQGVRCAAGVLKRLYAKTASGGSITAPEFGAGDPTVSARSAVLGDVIQPGQSRWYLVYYRDPVVLGGCPATSTFNTTQTGEIAWSP